MKPSEVRTIEDYVQYQEQVIETQSNLISSLYDKIGELLTKLAGDTK